MTTAQQTVTSTITWFEIPASDFARAVRFYETIFATPLVHNAAFPNLGIFPYERPGVSGCVASGEGHRPCPDGTIVYLNCDGRIDQVLDRAHHGPAHAAEDHGFAPASYACWSMIPTIA